MFHFLSTHCAPGLPYHLFHPSSLVCVGLTREADGQGELLELLEEVEEGSSDWSNGFFTFLYGLITPLDHPEEEHSSSGGVVEVLEEDEEEEDGGARRGIKDYGKDGQKIVIVGLHNQ